jgi:cbb3-type cytochrome c oxidase subunit III
VAAKPVEEKKEVKEEKEEKKEAEPAQTKKVSGSAVYAAQKCGACHGADGKGKAKNSPDFTDAAWQKKTSDAHMITQIKNGKDPVMPPYKDKLNDAEIKAVVAYIRSFAK